MRLARPLSGSVRAGRVLLGSTRRHQSRPEERWADPQAAQQRSADRSPPLRCGLAGTLAGWREAAGAAGRPPPPRAGSWQILSPSGWPDPHGRRGRRREEDHLRQGHPWGRSHQDQHRDLLGCRPGAAPLRDPLSEPAGSGSRRAELPCSAAAPAKRLILI